MDEFDQIPTVDVKFKDVRWEKPVHAGHMTKCKSFFEDNKPFYWILVGSFFPSWRKRFFILTHDGRLWYFKNDKQRNPKKKNPIYVRDMKFWAIDKKQNCVKIERYPKPFYFYGKAANDRLQWLERLAAVGGIKCENEIKNKDINRKDLPSISKKDVKGWNTKLVNQWLTYHTFGKNQSFSLYAEQFQNVTGKELEKITEHDLMAKGITKLAHRKKMIRAIKEIRQKRLFNYGEHVVYQKVEKMTRNFGKIKNGNWKYLARSLSDPECMQETYLNASILQETLNKYIGSHEEELDISGTYDDHEEADLVDKDVEEIACSIRNEPREKLKLPVKLVVTEMVKSGGYKTARRLLSPVLSKIPNLSKEFGIFHTALIIGPWYLEWTDSSLVIPRKLYSGMALISADIDPTTMLKHMTVDEITEKLAKVICRWNTTMMYCNVNVRGKSKMGNCQEFVEDVMSAISISLDKQGAFGRFLEDMKNKGCCEMEFCPTKEFKEKFELKLDKYRFETHIELDEFVINTSKVDEIGFQIDYKEEQKLLKSFDRAFWLRHFKRPQEDQFKPSPAGCPFDDPRKTKSYMQYN